MAALQLLTLALLAGITLEDLRSRAVHWYLFPLLAVSLCAIRLYNHQSLWQVLTDMGLNLLLTGLQLGLVTAYFSWKNRQLINITRSLLGWGDILLVGCLAVALPLPLFLIFYILSLVAVLVFWFIYQAARRSTSPAIPLAGLQALLFAALLVTGWLNPDTALLYPDRLIALLAR